MIIPKFDSRALSFYKYYGTVAGFEDEYDVDSAVINDIQPCGDVRCTAYACVGVAEDKERIGYSVSDLFDRIESNTQGADPNVTIKEAITNGLMPEGGTIRFKPFSSYFTAHTGVYDSFDNCRSALKLAKYSFMAWGPWYRTWGVSSILQSETDFSNYHAVKITGWTQKYGEPMLVIDAFVGRPLYMKRAVFNKWTEDWGFGSAVLSTEAISKMRIKTWTEQVNDLMVNLIVSIRGTLAELLKKKETMNFDNPKQAYHSTRVMCDNAGFTLSQKNDLCATVFQESQFIKGAVGKPNYDGSIDYGLCQYNSNPKLGWIGKGCLFSSPQDCIDNPERAVANMIKEFKNGHQNWWMGYAVRQKWLAPNSPMWKLRLTVNK